MRLIEILLSLSNLLTMLRGSGSAAPRRALGRLYGAYRTAVSLYTHSSGRAALADVPSLRVDGKLLPHLAAR